MKLINQYNTPMGVMRHEIAEDQPLVATPFFGGGKETINSLAPTKKDYIAFAFGFGLLLAIAVFSLWLIL